MIRRHRTVVPVDDRGGPIRPSTKPLCCVRAVPCFTGRTVYLVRYRIRADLKRESMQDRAAVFNNSHRQIGQSNAPVYSREVQDVSPGDGHSQHTEARHIPKATLPKERERDQRGGTVASALAALALFSI